MVHFARLVHRDLGVASSRGKSTEHDGGTAAPRAQTLCQLVDARQ
jgi:hypothetical protein